MAGESKGMRYSEEINAFLRNHWSFLEVAKCSLQAYIKRDCSNDKHRGFVNKLLAQYPNNIDDFLSQIKTYISDSKTAMRKEGEFESRVEAFFLCQATEVVPRAHAYPYVAQKSKDYICRLFHHPEESQLPIAIPVIELFS